MATVNFSILSLDDAVLVTADERYYGKASRRGRLVLLRDFSC